MLTSTVEPWNITENKFHMQIFHLLFAVECLWTKVTTPAIRKKKVNMIPWINKLMCHLFHSPYGHQVHRHQPVLEMLLLLLPNLVVNKCQILLPCLLYTSSFYHILLLTNFPSCIYVKCLKQYCWFEKHHKSVTSIKLDFCCIWSSKELSPLSCEML